MEDASYALRHFKASHKGASPLSVLENNLLCIHGIPRWGLSHAQEMTEQGGDLVNDLRLVAGKQFDKAEQSSNSHLALPFVHNVGIPLAQRLYRLKKMLKHACHSAPLADQLSADLDYIVSTEAKLAETYLPTLKDDLHRTNTAFLLRNEIKENIFSTRQLCLFKKLEKRYVNVIARVERLPDRKEREALLAVCEYERVGWAALSAHVQAKDYVSKYRKKK
jgi:hypothetical protein